jgi:mannose-6-phosphate isomerase-like protein (cupin superfamily)
LSGLDAPLGGEHESTFAARLTGGRIGSPSASFVVVEWTDPGGGDEPPRYIAPLHIHHDDDEAWYVLDGLLRVRVGESDVDVPAGGAVLVPRGTPHTYWNPRAEPARYLLVMTPRIEQLIAALHALPDRDHETVAAVFREHGSTYLGWP